MAVENATTLFVTLLALGLIGWGYFRARTFGRYGVLAWLQSILLIAPWLLFFGLFSLGIYINLAAILFLFLIAAGVYIYLGRKLRAAEKEQLQSRLKRMVKNTATSDFQKSESSPLDRTSDASSEGPNSTGPHSAGPHSAGPHSAGPHSAGPHSTPEQIDTSTLNDEIVLPFPEIHPIPTQDLEQIKRIFGIDTFFSTETIAYQDGAIFKGNLRGDPQVVYQRLSSKLEALLHDRYRLFLVEGIEGKPVVIVLPRTNDPKPQGIAQRLLALILGLATIVTSLERGGLQYGYELFEQLEHLQDALPIGSGILCILLGHELGHWWMARRYQIRLSWPLLIPAWQLGSFGAITNFESVLPNRTTLFDIAFAGPAIGVVLSFMSLLLGLLLPSDQLGIQLPTSFFQGSVLVGLLARVILGGDLQGQIVVLHPLFIIGWLGLIITAFNLVPAGQLDGGRIVQAIYGRKTARRSTIASLILLVLASFVNPLALYWAILVVFLQRQSERPAMEELTEPDDIRAILGLLLLLLMLGTLLPLSPSLASRLGIGISPQYLHL